MAEKIMEIFIHLGSNNLDLLARLNTLKSILGHQKKILAKKTIELVFLFHKKTTKIVFLWHNIRKKSIKVLTAFF